MFSLTQDGDFLNDISFGDAVHNFLSGDYRTENAVFAVQPRGGNVGDKELASVRIGTGVCHGEDSRTVVFEYELSFVIPGKLIVELITGTSVTFCRGITALNHKILNDSVESESVVEVFAFELLGYSGVIAFGKGNEVGYGTGNSFVFQTEQDVSFVGFHLGVEPVFQAVKGFGNLAG